MKKFISLLLSLVMLVTSLSICATVSLADDATQIKGYFDYDYATEVLSLVNEQRAANGEQALTLNYDLTQAAMMRAAELIVKFSHTRPNNTDCFTAYNISTAAGENIARFYSTPADVMTAWMESEGHKANILTSSYTQIGIGCFRIYGGTPFWVQVFDCDTPAGCTVSGQQDAIVNVSLDENAETQVNFVAHNYSYGVCTYCKKYNLSQIPVITCGETNVTVTQANTDAFYKFTPQSTGDYIFKSLSPNTSCFLYDANLNLLNSQCKFENNCFYNVYSFTAGTTYIFELNYDYGKTGTFTVSLQKESDNIGTNTAAKSTSSTKKPKSTSIKKLTKGKKKITVQWKKVSGVKGYQVQLATDKNFKKNKKTVNIAKQSATKTTVKKLKSKKKYYVRVRTYKTLNGKKIYSSWSKVKTIKTK